MKKLSAILVVAAVSAFVVAVASAQGSSAPTAVGVHASGVHWTHLAMTVAYPWDGTGEHVVTSSLPGCLPGSTVVTSPNPDRLVGNVWIFTGTKAFTCSDGSFTVAYRAYRIGEATSALGTWKVTGGTGSYGQMTGAGLVQGKYTYDANGNKTGINDTYVGLVDL